MRPLVPLVCLSIFIASQVMAMPPHPRVLEMIQKGEIEEPFFMKDPSVLVQKGINQGRSAPLAALSQPSGQFKVLAILVDFSDKPSQVAATFFDSLIFSVNGNTVRKYYRDVSYLRLDLVTVHLPSAIGWKRMPQTYAYYVNNQYGWGSYPRNAQRLTEDAVNAANPVVDFSQYDNDGDGYVDALFIVHAGSGAEYTGSTSDIWSHAWNCSYPVLVDGVRVYRYSMEPEYWSATNSMTCGVYVHELGHVFGLPDFYDYGGDSRGLGSWSVMAGGSWNGNLGSSPAHFDAYSRSFLGFVTPINLTVNTDGVSLPAVEDTGVVYRLWTNGQNSTEYFLVENRRRTGFDSALPAAGMLIYHIDALVSGNDHQWYPGYTDSGHYQVALEQADGRWDLEKNVNSGDGGDPFPGTYNKRTFDYSSTPNSRSYAGANTYVAVTNISNAGSVMTANMAVANAPAIPNPVAPANGAYTNNRRPTFDFSDSPGAVAYHIQIDDNPAFSSPAYDVNNLTVSQFTPSSDLIDAIYYWRVRASNGAAWSSWSTVWNLVVDATAPGIPTSLTANGGNPSPWTNNPTISLNWSNPFDLSGIDKALYKVGTAPTFAYDTTGSLSPSPPASFVITVQGATNVYLWLADRAGNVSHANRALVVVRYDGTRPVGCIASSPDSSASLSFRVRWTVGSDNGGSGLSGRYNVQVKIDNGTWQLWLNGTTDTSAIYTGLHGHVYRFEAQNIDLAGNIENFSGAGEATTVVDTTIYIPGDANHDGLVRASDVTYLAAYFRGTNPPPNPLLAGDANGDCVVSGADVTYLVRYLRGLGPAPQRGFCP